MLKAKIFQVADKIKCKDHHIATHGCFVRGSDYPILYIKNGLIGIACEAECQHHVHMEDVGHYFHIPVVIERNVPQWF